MVRWLEPLFLAEDVGKQIKKIKRKAAIRRATGVYVVVLKPEGDNLMEIMPIGSLFQPYCRKDEFQIIGAAKNRGAAIEVTEQIFTTIYRETGGLEVRRYFKQRNGG